MRVIAGNDFANRGGLVQGAAQLPSHLGAARKPAGGSHKVISAKAWQTSLSAVCHTGVTGAAPSG